MKTNRNKYDSLNTPATEFYVPKKPQLDKESDIASLQMIALKRDAILKAKECRYLRRTYNPGYIMYPDNKPNVVNIDNDEQIRLRHVEELDGYGTDDYGNNYVVPFVGQLPGECRSERWIYGYKYSDWDGATLFLDVCDSDEALRLAKREAEHHAQQCYDDWLDQEREQRIVDIKENLARARDDTCPS